jgi:DNA anti-recombination protein RmuC
MENQDTMNYIVDMLKQINQTTLVLSQNQVLLFDQVKALNEKYEKLDAKIDTVDQKIDDRCDALDQKIDDRCDALDQKIDDRCDALDQKIDDRCDALDQKIDSRCDDLDQKFDDRCDALDTKYEGLSQKLDRYYEENRKDHYKMMQQIAGIQKDVKDLRTDIDTVYDLEKDSQKKIEKLM